MAGWENASGHALSSAAWLEAHHRAKLPERTRFAQSLSPYEPRQVLDLGCGTGLWLDLIDKVLPPECKFIGVDNDPDSLRLARARASLWEREAEFLKCDLIEDFDQVPPADLMLAFNLLPYIPNASEILAYLRENAKIGRIVIRQYDGGTMRIGPLSPDDRHAIDASLHIELKRRSGPSHYDLDRAYQLAYESGLKIEKLDFELTQRHAPFPPDFVSYFKGTVAWMSEHLPDESKRLIEQVLRPGEPSAPLYFMQADLIAVLSASRGTVI